MKSGQEEGAGRRRPALGENMSQWMRYLLLLFAVGVVLMSFNNKAVRDVDAEPADLTVQQRVAPAGAAVDDYARSLERLVQDALLQLQGVRRVHVAITLAGGPRKVLAETVTTERRSNEAARAGDEPAVWVVDERLSSQPVLVRNDQSRQESPIVLVEYLPAIEGVVVVADGAADSMLRLEMTRAVATLLGVPSHRVYVLPHQLD